jgi:hypothetical protein
MALTQCPVPGVCARPEWTTNHMGARDLEGREWLGALLQVPWQAADGQREAAVVTRGCWEASQEHYAHWVLRALLSSLQLQGLQQPQERASSGECYWDVKFYPATACARPS